MRKLKSYMAISLNGKIAAKDGSVDWLEAIPNPDKLDYGYADFYNSIDTTIQGYSTYKQIMDWGIEFPYVSKTNYVLTRKQNLKNTEHVTFLNENPFQFIEGLKKKEGKDIWVIGGGQINTMLLNEKLIDEIQVFVMPIIISDGIDLFEMLPKQSHLELIESKNFPTGVVELKNKVIN